MTFIRPAAKDDAVELPDVERSAGQSFLAIPDLAWIAADAVMQVEDHAPRIRDGTTWVAEQRDSRIVGFLSAQRFHDALHVWELAVSREYQRRGIGTRLLEAATEWAAAHGVGRLVLTTFRDVPWNQPYYQRQGFAVLEPSIMEARLVKVLEDEVKSGLEGSRRCAMQKVL